MIIGILASTQYYCRDCSIWLPVVMPVVCRMCWPHYLTPLWAESTSGVRWHVLSLFVHRPAFDKLTLQLRRGTRRLLRPQACLQQFRAGVMRWSHRQGSSSQQLTCQKVVFHCSLKSQLNNLCTKQQALTMKVYMLFLPVFDYSQKVNLLFQFGVPIIPV